MSWYKDMLHFFTRIGLVTIAGYLSIIGCTSFRPVPGTSWLPGDGEGTRGQKTFKSMGCFSCHAVSDPDIPPPVSSKPFRIPLDARVRNKPAHELAAAIIHPLHLTPESKESKPLGDYADVLTVQQLTDLIVYLKELNR